MNYCITAYESWNYADWFIIKSISEKNKNECVQGTAYSLGIKVVSAFVMLIWKIRYTTNTKITFTSYKYLFKQVPK